MVFCCFAKLLIKNQLAGCMPKHLFCYPVDFWGALLEITYVIHAIHVVTEKGVGIIHGGFPGGRFCCY